MTQHDPDHLILLGGISADIKHILQMLEKQNQELAAIHARVNTLEAFRWKILGIVTAIPTFITALGLYFRAS